MRDFSKFPCGADGMSFPNGLPEPGQTVEIKTVWSDGQWQKIIFQETYSYGLTYRWFGVYGPPDIAANSLPIVLEWRMPDGEKS